MKVLVTGGTGFVGTKLISALLKEGQHEVVLLSRNPQAAKQKVPGHLPIFRWDPEAGKPPLEAFQGVHGVVHLAGEGIAEKRWTKKQKERIYSSRVAGTQRLVQAISELPGAKPHTIISASAIGFYGDRGEEVLNEVSPAGSGFLADVCRDWEKAIFKPQTPETRIAAVRIGIVLGRDGGMLKKVIPLFKTGLAGKLGNGKQYMSWIHVTDLVGLFLHVLKTSKLDGPINGTAPNPVTNSVFTSTLAKALSRPAFLPAPAFALKLALGELSALLLQSQRVLPDKALAQGFSFGFPFLDGALADVCAKR